MSGDIGTSAEKCKEGACVYVIPDLEELQRLRCGVCDSVLLLTPRVPNYNRKRRVYKHALGLTSLAIGFHQSSRQRIVELCRRFGIESNNTNVHVTLVDALNTRVSPEREQMIVDVHEALWVNNQVKVIGFDCIATKQTSRKLVVLLLQLCGPVGDAVSALKHHCARLPQYPLHCTFGVTSKANIGRLTTESSNFLQSCRDLEVYLNPFRLDELPPSYVADMKQVERLSIFLNNAHGRNATI
jgi:hypothetical protein